MKGQLVKSSTAPMISHVTQWRTPQEAGGVSLLFGKACSEEGASVWYLDDSAESQNSRMWLTLLTGTDQCCYLVY